MMQNYCISLQFTFTSVSVPPSLKNDSEPEAEKRVKKGESFVIEVPFNAFPRPKVTWTLDNQPIKDKRNFKVDLIDGMTSVSVSKVQPQDEGKLCVVIENDHGKCTQTTKIIVVGKNCNDRCHLQNTLKYF